MVHVEFSLEEMDLAFFYLDVQMKSFDKDGMQRPDHRILIGKDTITIELSIPDSNPDWPLGKAD